MDEDLHSYATVGLAYFLFWPTSVQDGQLMTDTLAEFVQRTDVETIDFTLPMDDDQRDRLLPVVRDCGKVTMYATHLFPMDKISLGTTADNEKGLLRLFMQDQIEVAAASGAKGTVFTSGIDLGEAARPAAKLAFAEFCRWFCPQLAARGMTAVLEPFDRDFDRKFLYGPTQEAVELVESLAPQVDNLSLQLDIAHIALQGETFSHAIHTAGKHITRMHLGNCVMRDRTDPFYGDRHAPIGYPGGEIDVPQLVDVLTNLLQIGYLSKANRGSLVIESQRWPGKTVEETIADSMGRLHEAWQLVEFDV